MAFEHKFHDQYLQKKQGHKRSQLWKKHCKKQNKISDRIYKLYKLY